MPTPTLNSCSRGFRRACKNNTVYTLGVAKEAHVADVSLRERVHDQRHVLRRGQGQAFGFRVDLSQYRDTSVIIKHHPSRATIGPWVLAYGRVLGGCVFRMCPPSRTRSRSAPRSALECGFKVELCLSMRVEGSPVRLIDLCITQL